MIFLFSLHRSLYVVFFAYHMKETWKLKHCLEVGEYSLPRVRGFDGQRRAIFNLFWSKGQLELEAMQKTILNLNVTCFGDIPVTAKSKHCV